MKKVRGIFLEIFIAVLIYFFLMGEKGFVRKSGGWGSRDEN